MYVTVQDLWNNWMGGLPYFISFVSLVNQERVIYTCIFSLLVHFSLTKPIYALSITEIERVTDSGGL